MNRYTPVAKNGISMTAWRSLAALMTFAALHAEPALAADDGAIASAPSYSLAGEKSVTPAIKELSVMIQQADFDSDPGLLLKAMSFADSHGFSEIGDLLSDLDFALGRDDFNAAAQVSAAIQAKVAEHLAAASVNQRLKEPEGQGGVAAPPANDECESPVVIASLPFATSIDVNEATADTTPTPPTCGFSGVVQKSVWYSVVGNGNVLRVSTCNPTANDTKIRVHCGTCAALVCNAGSDDFGGDAACDVGGGSLFASRVDFCSRVGTTYLLEVGLFSTSTTPTLTNLTVTDLGLACTNAIDCTGVASNCGNGLINSGEACDDGNAVSGDGCNNTCTTNENELCVSSRIMPPSLPWDTLVNTAAAAADPSPANQVGSCNTTATTTNRALWFRWTPSVTQCVKATLVTDAAFTSTSSFNDMFVVWTGTCPTTLTQVQCANTTTGTYSGVTETASWTASAGTTYYIQIGTAGTSTTGGRVSLRVDPLVGAATGACCTPGGGGCSVVAQCACLSPAVYLGDGTSCSLCASNDNCSSPKVIASVPYTDTVSATAASDDTNVNPSCDSSSNGALANNGVWYSYTPPVSCSATISETPIDTAISIWTGATCLTLTEAPLGCSDPQTMSFAMTGGTTYLILVSAWSSTNPSGNYGFSFDCQGPPANDSCATATTVTNGTPAATGSNCTASATDDAEASCAFNGNSNKDVWFSYTATCNGAAVMTTEGSAQSDTVLSAYASCGGAQVGCDDDGGTGLLSNMTFSVNSGTTYKIRVASYDTGCGGYNLNITCVAAVCGNGVIEPGEACDGPGALGPCVNGCSGSCQCLPPANDDCGNASTAVDGVNAFNRAFANLAPDGPDEPNPPCNFPFGADGIYADVWFNYTASCTGRLLTDTCNGAGLDTRIAVYPGCGCPASGPLSCNDDSGNATEAAGPDMDPDTCNQAGNSPFESATRNQVVQGQCYKIRVGSYGESDGAGGILVATNAGADELFIQCITKGACCDANNACVGGTISSECTGTFFAGASCDTQSCCLNGACVMLAAVCCSNAGGTPGGPGSDCNTCGNGMVDCGEQCDPPGPCCSATCQFLPGSTLCRASAGICDVPESCTGTSDTCPPDGFNTGNLCRGAAGPCDAPESCDGSGPNCPADAFTSGNECRASTGPCDPAESCDGSGAACPADGHITMCIGGDNCCPAGCTNANDSDCPLIVPTVSEWGLIALALIGMVAGSILFTRRLRSVDA